MKMKNRILVSSVLGLGLFFASNIARADEEKVLSVEEMGENFVAANEELSQVVAEEGGKSDKSTIDWNRINDSALVAFRHWSDMDRELDRLQKSANTNRFLLVASGSSTVLSMAGIAALIIWADKVADAGSVEGSLAAIMGIGGGAILGTVAVGSGVAALYFLYEDLTLRARIKEEISKTRDMVINLCEVYSLLADRGLTTIDRVFPAAAEACAGIEALDIEVLFSAAPES